MKLPEIEREAGVERIAVLGLGNVLMGDDAFGPTLIEILRAEFEFADDVAVMDLGTPGLDLTPFVTDREALILVDTVKSTGPPGTLRTYRKSDILKHPPQTRLSPHDPGVKEALLLADLVGHGASEVFLVGVIPQDVNTGVPLSAPLRQALPAAREAVLEELARLGRPARPRAEASAPDLWWEAVPSSAS